MSDYQHEWRQAWRGQYTVVLTVNDALAVVGVRLDRPALEGAGETK
jgi:hypothetical protein